jgi:hypothetical protein
MMKRRTRPQDSGVSLIGILIGLGMTSVIFLVLGSFITATMKDFSGDTLELNLLSKQTQLYSAISNPIAWANTASAAWPLPGFACLNAAAPGATCTNGAKNFIAVYDSFPAPGNKIADLPNSPLGLSPSGSVCNSFVAAGGGNCPAQYIVWLTIDCGKLAVCPVNTAVILVTGTLSVGTNPPSQFAAINKQIYTFTQSITSNNSSYSEICSTGTWNGVSPLAATAAVNGLNQPIFNPAQAAAVMFAAIPLAGNAWGISCSQPYGVAGCTGTLGASGDPSAMMTKNGCFGTANNWLGITLSITCCGSG